METIFIDVRPSMPNSPSESVVSVPGAVRLSRDDRLDHGSPIRSSISCLLLLEKELSMKWGKCGNQLKTTFSLHTCRD